MKKFLILVISLFLLTACTSNEEDKIAYLEYKNDLEKQEVFTSSDDLPFKVYFNVTKEGEEITNYSVLINDASTDMYNVKALLIHDYMIDEAYPSIGILDDTVSLRSGSDDKIVLSGKIQTSLDVSNVKYKLYIEYTDSDGNDNKIYYDVNRG